MKCRRIVSRSLCVAALLSSVTLPAFAIEPTATVVEFYNTALKHYFMTANPAEAAGIDTGAAGP